MGCFSTRHPGDVCKKQQEIPMPKAYQIYIYISTDLEDVFSKSCLKKKHAEKTCFTIKYEMFLGGGTARNRREKTHIYDNSSGPLEDRIIHS